MEKPTPEKALLTPKEAVDYAAYYLKISREEAGKLLAEERPIKGQIYFERDPMAKKVIAAWKWCANAF